MSRFIKADLNADRFSWSVDDDAVAKAELFDGKLALITNAPDLTAANAVARYKDLADIERKKRIPGPPPQPTMPAVRQAILDILAHPPPLRCPHCERLIRGENNDLPK